MIPRNITELTSSKNFFFIIGHQRAQQIFSSKLEFCREKNCVGSNFEKNHFYYVIFSIFGQKKLIKSLSWLYKQKLRRLKFWWKSFLPCQFCLFWIKTNIKSLYCLKGSDFFQNLSLDNFRLGSQKNDFMCFFIKKWKKDIKEVIFFKIWAYTIFFAKKIQF